MLRIIRLEASRGSMAEDSTVMQSPMPLDPSSGFLARRVMDAPAEGLR